MLSLKPGHWDILSQRFPRDTKRHKALTVLESSWSSGQEGNGIGATWPSREDTLSHFCNKGCWGGWRWNAVSTQFWGPGRRPASFSSQELLKSTPHTHFLCGTLIFQVLCSHPNCPGDRSPLGSTLCPRAPKFMHVGQFTESLVKPGQARPTCHTELQLWLQLPGTVSPSVDPVAAFSRLELKVTRDLPFKDLGIFMFCPTIPPITILNNKF